MLLSGQEELMSEESEKSVFFLKKLYRNIEEKNHLISSRL